MEDNEEPVVAGFFSKRAKFVPKKSAEELKVASELVNKIQEEKTKGKAKQTEEVAPFLAKPPARNTRTRAGKKASSEPKEVSIEDVIDDDIPASPEVKLSAAAKRRLKKLQEKQDLELKRIEAENQRILSTVNASEYNEVLEVVDEDEFDSLHVLTISYLSEFTRLKCHKTEKFATIFPRVAELFKMKVSEFLLCLKDKNITMGDSPDSLNIADCDVLECIPYKADENVEEGIQYDADKLKITFQSNDTKVKTDMFIHKIEQMKDVMERYAKLRSIPLNQLSFEFDGEKISGSETPEDLDMESGNCIDVTVLNPDQICTPKKRKKEPVVTIDSDSNDSDILPCD